MKLHTVAKQQINTNGVCAIYRTTEHAAKQTAAHLTEWVRDRSCGRQRLDVEYKEIAGRFMIVGILFDAIAGEHMVA